MSYPHTTEILRETEDAFVAKLSNGKFRYGIKPLGTMRDVFYCPNARALSGSTDIFDSMVDDVVHGVWPGGALVARTR